MVGVGVGVTCWVLVAVGAKVGVLVGVDVGCGVTICTLSVGKLDVGEMPGIKAMSLT